MGRVLLGAVGVLALQALFGLGYLALSAPDPLVEKGIWKVLICGSRHERGARMQGIATSGTWGTDHKGGGCVVWLHYAPGGSED